MEVDVEILADLAVCGLSCNPFVFRVFFLAFELNITSRISMFSLLTYYFGPSRR